MKILKSSRGTSLVEYVLILVMVAVAAIGTLKVLRTAINAKYTETAIKVTAAE